MVRFFQIIASIFYYRKNFKIRKILQLLQNVIKMAVFDKHLKHLFTTFTVKVFVPDNTV